MKNSKYQALSWLTDDKDIVPVQGKNMTKAQALEIQTLYPIVNVESTYATSISNTKIEDDDILEFQLGYYEHLSSGTGHYSLIEVTGANCDKAVINGLTFYKRTDDKVSFQLVTGITSIDDAVSKAEYFSVKNNTTELQPVSSLFKSYATAIDKTNNNIQSCFYFMADNNGEWEFRPAVTGNLYTYDNDTKEYKVTKTTTTEYYGNIVSGKTESNSYVIGTIDNKAYTSTIQAYEHTTKETDKVSNKNMYSELHRLVPEGKKLVYKVKRYDNVTADDLTNVYFVYFNTYEDDDNILVKIKPK